MPRFIGGTFVNQDGEEYISDEQDLAPGERHPFISCIDELYRDLTYANENLYVRVINLLCEFTNLSTLTCKNMLLTDAIFGAIHFLEHLRALHIDNCVLPSRQTEWDHSELPITELTLLNLRRRIRRQDFHAHHPPHFENDLEPALNLAQAQTLRTLRVDPTADVFGTVFRDPTSSLPPLELTQLLVERRRIVMGEAHTHYSADYTPPDRHVYRTIMRCPNLHTLVVTQPFGQQTPFPSANLQNLVNFKGTPEASLLIAQLETVECISILWNEAGTQALNAISTLGKARQNLKSLAIECGQWDFEILIAVTKFFPELRRLKITFQRKGPDETATGMIGPHYLTKCPHLHTFQLLEAPHPKAVFSYSSNPPNMEHGVPMRVVQRQAKPPPTLLPSSAFTDNPYLFDPTFDSIEEEMRDMIIPWNRYCKSLRVVQLCRSWRMNRGFEGGVWKIEKVRESEYELPEDFNI
ncbi:hypothetical protein QCA50_011947 [Cerrena zonata]|uniref:Uncharacterized protein n=1 Tax=Cerrena zonata TaxID=2478898 RepID=A0AAW0FVK4_9APHY